MIHAGLPFRHGLLQRHSLATQAGNGGRQGATGAVIDVGQALPVPALCLTGALEQMIADLVGVVMGAGDQHRSGATLAQALAVFGHALRARRARRAVVSGQQPGFGQIGGEQFAPWRQLADHGIAEGFPGQAAAAFRRQDRVQDHRYTGQTRQ